MSDSTSNPDDVSADEHETAKGRSPIERLIVWSLIGGLVVVLGIEAFSKNGYDSTFAAVQEQFQDKEAMNRLSSIRTSISGWPSESKTDGLKVGDKVANRVIALRWFSFFKHYELQLTVEAGEDDPVVIWFKTPEAPEEAAPVVASSGDEGTDGADMGMPGMGFAPGGMGGHDAAAPGGSGPGGPGGGGGQRGGRNRPVRGLLGELGQEWVQAELGMTDDQLAKLPEIAASLRPDFSSFGGMSDEERQTAFQEMESKGEAAAKGLLDAEQFGRAREFMFQRMGVEAFARDDVATELGLDDSQKKQVLELMAELRGAERSLGFRASREERDSAKSPWKALLLEVLSDEQNEKWEALLGAPPEKGPEPEPPARPQRPASDSE